MALPQDGTLRKLLARAAALGINAGHDDIQNVGCALTPNGIADRVIADHEASVRQAKRDAAQRVLRVLHCVKHETVALSDLYEAIVDALRLRSDDEEKP